MTNKYYHLLPDVVRAPVLVYFGIFESKDKT